MRYPGGKALLAPYISGVIEENFLTGCTFYEPYAGGASASLELLRLGFIGKAVWVEKDPLVYAFWKCCISANDALCDAISKCDITLERWHSLQPARMVANPHHSGISLIDLGLAGIFFNRTNFSGIIGAGPIGGLQQKSKYKIDCRFNKDRIIEQIKQLKKYRKQITVNFGDAINFLKKNAEIISSGFSFVYVDPPYYDQGARLYRHSYEDAQHVELADFIKAQGYPWLLSYDDHPRIRYLYASASVQPIYLDYKVKSNRRAQELVISNLEIPPPVYGDIIAPAPVTADLFDSAV
ncbi:DNA adenine methylase [Xenophilus arseniciresistens]|uniref:site-specific DNA-methyltransferase (adenine-specific) n=1 Tax=Xenophilus arseniciresistens TaxID=1283306 RepID=A0AAE3N3E3_9BURK|nr:DNA adenine methylase [Xenophilus arseniciresistens]MDA7414820.1 DNA adenine methylase [Xenophilus arseniciresistens]